MFWFIFQKIKIRKHNDNLTLLRIYFLSILLHLNHAFILRNQAPFPPPTLSKILMFEILLRRSANIAPRLSIISNIKILYSDFSFKYPTDLTTPRFVYVLSAKLIIGSRSI